MRFQVGDIVRIGKESEYYECDWRDNPKDMNGVITEFYEYGDDTRIMVVWDDGETNSYVELDLKLRGRN